MAKQSRKHMVHACIATKFKVHRAQGRWKRRRFCHGTMPTYLTQGIFLLMQVQGYTPAEILLRFNQFLTLKMNSGLEDFVKRDLATDTMEPSALPEELAIHGYIDSCEERGVQAEMRLAEKQDRLQAKKSPGYRTPKGGDLILIRNFQQAKNKGRKLEPRWSTPRIL